MNITDIKKEEINNKIINEEPNKEEKKETINKITTENIVNNNINNNNNNIDKKESNIQNIPNQEANQNTEKSKKKISFKEAQETIQQFKKLVDEIEKKIKNKYGDCLPDFSYEEHLPVTLKTKLITTFFESDDMKYIINKMNQEQN